MHFPYGERIWRRVVRHREASRGPCVGGITWIPGVRLVQLGGYLLGRQTPSGWLVGRSSRTRRVLESLEAFAGWPRGGCSEADSSLRSTSRILQKFFSSYTAFASEAWGAASGWLVGIAPQTPPRYHARAGRYSSPRKRGPVLTGDIGLYVDQNSV